MCVFYIFSSLFLYLHSSVDLFRFFDRRSKGAKTAAFTSMLVILKTPLCQPVVFILPHLCECFA